MEIDAELRLVQRYKADIARLEECVGKGEQQLATATQELADAQAAQETLQILTETVQKQVHQQICEVVSLCLSTVFDDPYEFKIEFDKKYNKTEARIRFVRRGLDVDPTTASGGGMIDVAAFALRVACIMLHRPKLSRVVVIDEGFKFVSEEYQDNVCKMLEELSEKLRIQIIQVTHIKKLETGKVVEL